MRIIKGMQAPHPHKTLISNHRAVNIPLPISLLQTSMVRSLHLTTTTSLSLPPSLPNRSPPYPHAHPTPHKHP